MSPKIVDKEQRKREIVLVALEVFAEFGFEATSISRIAEAAGVSKGSIYLYFDSKEELIVEVACAWVAAVEQRISPLLDENPDPLIRLRTLFRESTAAFIENPRMIMLFLGIVQVTLRDRALLDRLDLMRKVSAPFRRAILAILLDGVSAGIFRPEVADIAEKIAINLVAFVDGVGLHHVADPGFFDLPEQIDIYLEGLVRSLSRSHG